MAQNSKPSGDNSFKSENVSDVSNVPPTDGFHEELHKIVSLGDGKATTASPAPGTTGDTSNPNIVDSKGAVPSTVSADASPIDDKTPPKVAEEQRSYVNPKFQNESTANLQTILKNIPVSGNEKLFTEAHQEIIARFDKMLPLKEANSAVSSIAIIQDALEAGKQLKVDDGRVALTDADLSVEDRWHYHQAIASDLFAMNDQVNSRQDYARFLRSIGNVPESDKISDEAVELSERPPADLIRRQAKSAQNLAMSVGSDTPMGQELKRFSNFLNMPGYGFDKNSLVARKEAVANSLGLKTETVRNFIGVKTSGVDLTFGTEKGFNADKAFELASGLRQKTIELTGKDPITTGDKVNGAFLPFIGKFDQVDFSKTNVYAMAEQLSGRRFEGTGKISTEEFSQISSNIFDRIDTNKDEQLDRNELKTAVADTTLTDGERQTVETLNETQDLLRGLDKTDGWHKGVTRRDLYAFVKEQQESTERLEKISDARSALLSSNEFDSADGNSNKYLTQDELRNFLTAKANSSSPLSESKLRSFNFLDENFSKLSRSWWGLSRSDLADTRTATVQRVESSLWKSYYNTRTYK